VTIVALSAFILAAVPRAQAMNDSEQPAGESFAFIVGPADDMFGVSGQSGVWIRDTPVFGNYFIDLFWNGLEDSLYAGLGLSIRLMPHWRFAPFAGVGGSYNHSFGQPSADTPEDGGEESYGDSYWSGHVEAGMRLNTGGRWRMVELSVRHFWSSADGDRDSWFVCIGAGTGTEPVSF